MFKVEINTASAAFNSFPEGELIRMLQEVKQDLFDGNGDSDQGTIKDINGNTVGMWEFNPGGKVK
jgi:hypothetical protein